MVDSKWRSVSIKVLHLVGGSIYGGAAKGAYTLHKALSKYGIESKLLTNSRDEINDPTVININRTRRQNISNFINRKLDNLPTHLYPNRRKTIFSTSLAGYNFLKNPHYEWADIIHLHWINDGFLNIKHLSDIENKSIIWTMRDMWPMTGGCHAAEALGCTRYQNKCGKCIQLDSDCRFDLSSFVYKRKRKYLPERMTLVGISNWLSECARRSSLFSDFNIITIPNNINTKDFFPIDKMIAKDILGVPVDKKIILVEGHDPYQFYKGFGKFIDNLKYMDNRQNLFLLLFGDFLEEVVDDIDMEYRNLGYLNDLISLRVAYSCADVFVSPSNMDAFGKTIAEAMSCGTPAVCFGATGPKEIVAHKVNGYKAKPFCYDDLFYGINWVLDNSGNSELNKCARDKIVGEFDSHTIASKYIQLYKNIQSK